MNKQLNTILQLYLKKIILTVLLFGTVFIMYKMYSAFFEKVDYIWRKGYQMNYTELLMMAKHRLEDAEMDVDMFCSSFSFIRNVESEECKRAKEKYKKALEQYNQMIAKRDEILNVEKNVKSYYMAVARAARQYPLPLLLFVFSAVVFAILVYIFMKEMFPKKNKEVEV